MAPRGAEGRGLLMDLRRRLAAALMAAAAHLEAASVPATATQLEMDTALLASMRLTLSQLLELPPVADTPT